MPPSKPLPKAPDSLTTAAKKLWREVVEQFILEPHHLQLLRRALEQWDRGEAAREILAVEGLTVLDRFQQLREHPCVAIERASALAFKTLMREVGLDIVQDAPRGPARPGARN